VVLMNGTERRAASGENLQSTLAPSLSTRFQTGNWSTEAFCCFSELFPLVCLYALEFHTAGLGTVLFASTIKVECTFRHMSDLFIAAPLPIHNELYSSLGTAAANSMAVEPSVHCLSSKAPSHIRPLPINARVQIRCASAPELCRAFENRLLPHGFLPVHDNSRARIGHSVRRSLHSIGRASNPSPRFRNDMTASCSCMIPPLPSSTSQIAAAAHASCFRIIGRLFRAGELLFVVVISCCPLSITKGGQLRYGDRRSHIIGREIIEPRHCFSGMPTSVCVYAHSSTSSYGVYGSRCSSAPSFRLLHQHSSRILGDTVRISPRQATQQHAASILSEYLGMRPN
jgi:hypothetical protein